MITTTDRPINYHRITPEDWQIFIKKLFKSVPGDKLSDKHEWLSAKRGLNRSISDASWGELFSKIEWKAAKVGKPVLSVNPKFTSQECSACHHVSKNNRDGEKFVCEECGHIDHSDTQASRTILRRAKLSFVRKDIKILPVDCGEVTIVRYDSACKGKRNRGNNPTSKAVQLSLFETGIVENIA